MESILKSDIYINDLNKIMNLTFIDYSKLKDKSIMISGASGMIGSFLVDVIMKLNKEQQLNCTIYALGRTKDKSEIRFKDYWNHINFKFISGDINYPIAIDSIKKIDFVLHLASNTHPEAYATDPIGTIMTNVVGTQNMLEFASEHNAERFVFASSCEIYGENIGNIEKFGESYLGYIDCNTLRAGYSESKRCGEALCQAYIFQKKMNIVIPRLSRTFGPTMLMNDSKALSQFIKNGINKENIVLKSEGSQYYSYTYVPDAVSGILKVMLDGKCGETYNISDERSNIKLKELAKAIAEYVGTTVTFELPNEIEKAGFSKATKSVLDNTKLKKLGWKAQYDIKQGLKNTIDILNTRS